MSRIRTQGVFARMALLTSSIVVVSCTNQGGFGGDGGKKIEMPQVQPAKPTSAPPVIQQAPPQEVAPAAAASAPTQTPIPIQPTATPMPIIAPPIQSIPTQVPVVPTQAPVVAPPQGASAAGQMEFIITAFSNMEHGYHATEHGYRAVLEDSQGVVASAKMNVDACVNSELADAGPGQGYTRVVLRPEAQYIREGASGGQAQFKICLDGNLDKPNSPASCQDVSGASLAGGDAERAVQFDGSVNYTVSGKNVQVNANSPGLSAWHPVFGFACPQRSFKDYQSPIVLDLNFNSKPDLIDVWNEKKKVYFDLRAEGKSVRTGWVGSQDGFLVLDENGAGKVIDGTTMLGEYTLKRGDASSKGQKNFENGFAALAQWDDNKDGKINQDDPIFSKLKVWIDRNSNGSVDKSEMVSLGKLKIAEISLAYEKAGTEVSPYVVADNEVRLKGTFKTSDGKMRSLYDVWFKQRRFSDTSLSSK